MKILVLLITLLLFSGCSEFIHQSCSELLGKRIYDDFLEDTNECQVHGFCVSNLGEDL